MKPDSLTSESRGAARREAVVVFVDAATHERDAREVIAALRERFGAAVMRVPAPAEDGVDARIARVLRTLHPRMIVAYGGDALISSIASAVRGEPVEIAIVPAGVGSHTIARSLAIPTDREAACAAIGRAAASDVDVLEVGDAAVLGRVLFGRFSELDRHVEAPRSWLSRGWSVLGELFGARLTFELEVDGEIHRMRATSVVVANAGNIGVGALQWAPGIEPGDGRFDVVVVHASTIFDYAALLWSWVSGRPRPRQSTHLRVHRRLVVRTRRPVSVTLDGRHERHAELTIEIAAAPLRVVLPAAQVFVDAAPLRVEEPAVVMPMMVPQAS